MKPLSATRVCILLGLAFSVLATAANAMADEPLPDTSLLAARPHQPSTSQPKISDVTLTGVIVDAKPGGLTVTASKSGKGKNQKQWLVLSGGSTEVSIHGLATLDYLRHGHIVEFSGQITPSGNVADKVDDLTIYAYKRKPPSKKGGNKDQAVDQPGERIEASKAAGDSDVLSLADDDAKAGDGGNGGKPAAAAGGSKTKIVARITAHDTKSLTMTAGERTIHADLGETPTIHVEFHNPKMVQSGSKLEIQGTGPSGHLVTFLAKNLSGAKIVARGTGAEGKAGNECMAKDIDITLATPLTGKKPAASAATKKSASEN